MYLDCRLHVAFYLHLFGVSSHCFITHKCTQAVIAYTVRVSVYAVIYALKLRALLLSTNKCVWK